MTDTGTAVAELLATAGVERLYTVPGESFLEVVDGVDRHPGLRLVSTRHESGAAFMADADAKMTGRPAVVAATRGVGASNAAIGVHTAMQDSTPMVVLLGQVDTGFLGREGFQEVDLPAFYAPITKWAATAHRADRIPELLAQALRIARAGRPGPTMIALPVDVLAEPVDDEVVALARRHVGMRLAGPSPDDAACAEIARLLTDARCPVIIAGGGAQNARSELLEVCGAFGVGVYSSFRRQDVFPNGHPQYLGHLGLGVGGARLDALREADLVLVVGARLSEVTTSGYELPAPTSQVVQIDIDASVIGAVAPTALGLVSDARAALEGLLRHRPSDAVVRDWTRARRAFEAAAAVPDSRAKSGVDPAQVIRAMTDVLPEDTVVANDAGNFSAFLHQHWLYRAARSQVAPTSGAMGYGIPGAIGAKIAAPGRTVVTLTGDGGFGMSVAELETAVREDVDVTAIVFRNGLYGTIAMHQARTTGRLAGVDIGEMSVCEIAAGFGVSAFSVDDEKQLDDALRDAVGTGGPSVVEVLTDPDVVSPSASLSSLLPRSAPGAGPPGSSGRP